MDRIKTSDMSIVNTGQTSSIVAELVPEVVQGTPWLYGSIGGYKKHNFTIKRVTPDDAVSAAAEMLLRVGTSSEEYLEILGPDQYRIFCVLIIGLQESNIDLFSRIVRNVDSTTLEQVMLKTYEIEDSGGMSCDETKRRKTPGGTFCKLLQLAIPKELTKLIWYNQSRNGKALKRIALKEKSNDEKQISTAFSGSTDGGKDISLKSIREKQLAIKKAAGSNGRHRNNNSRNGKSIRGFSEKRFHENGMTRSNRDRPMNQRNGSMKKNDNNRRRTAAGVRTPERESNKHNHNKRNGCENIVSIPPKMKSEDYELEQGEILE